DLPVRRRAEPPPARVLRDALRTALCDDFLADFRRLGVDSGPPRAFFLALLLLPPVPAAFVRFAARFSPPLFAFFRAPEGDPLRVPAFFGRAKPRSARSISRATSSIGAIPSTVTN